MVKYVVFSVVVALLSVSIGKAQFPPCDDTVFAEVHSDTVRVYHHSAEHNCCPGIVYALSQQDSVIDLLETDTLYGCDCICCIDVSVMVIDLPPGRYLIRVWNWDQSVLHGEVWVTIDSGSGTGPSLGQVIHSDCEELQLCGDVNCDGVYLSIADLLMWMHFTDYLYEECETMGCDTAWLECATLQSDMNSDGYPWAASDIVVFYRSMTTGRPLCDTIQPVFSDRDTMEIPDTTGSPGQIVSVSVKLSNTFPVCGAAFRIVYDSTLLTAIGTDTPGWLVGYGSCYVGEPLPPGAHSIAELTFAVDSAAAPGTLTYLTFEDDTIMPQFYNSLSDSIGTHVVPQLESGTFRIVSYLCGDCNGDGNITVADATYLVSHIYRLGPPPLGQGDVNLDSRITIADATYIVAFMYRGGPAPCEPRVRTTPLRRRGIER